MVEWRVHGDWKGQHASQVHWGLSVESSKKCFSRSELPSTKKRSSSVLCCPCFVADTLQVLAYNNNREINVQKRSNRLNFLRVQRFLLPPLLIDLPRWKFAIHFDFLMSTFPKSWASQVPCRCTVERCFIVKLSFVAPHSQYFNN